MAEEDSVRALSCPACGGTIALRAAGYTVTLACEYCGTLIDATDPAARIITRYNEMQASLAIPLGTRGTPTRSRRRGPGRSALSMTL